MVCGVEQFAGVFVMEVFLSKEIQAGLDAARRASLRKASRLRIDLNGRLLPVLRLWETGFAIAQEDAPNLRGLVDLYDGAEHLFQCLIVASEERHGEMHYEFKRATAVSDQAALDFEKRAHAPVGLIGQSKL
jgi:hypothetical protein